jgi:hypothetical protein
MYKADHHTISATRIAPVPSRAVANASMYLSRCIHRPGIGKCHFLAVSFTNLPFVLSQLPLAPVVFA